MLVVYLFYEVREVRNNPCLTICAKIKNHLANFWNKLDLAIYFFFIGSFVLKNFVATFMVARVFFAINGFLLYVRLLRVYHTSFSLGPKLIVFQKMVPQLQTFIVLLVVFLLGYGMASQALITPAAKFKHDYIGNLSLVEGILFAPYWQMYGELNLEDIDEKIGGQPARNILNSSQHCDMSMLNEEGELPWHCEDFSKYNFVVKGMLGVYMLIGNVMLLNMLIAIFSRIYEKVDKNAKSVWWYELYQLVEDYDQMPGLGPLFGPFELIYTVIMGLRKSCKKEEDIPKDYSAYFTGKFELFEKDSFNNFLRREAEKREAHVDSKIQKIEDKIAEMKNSIDKSESLYYQLF